MMRIGRSLMALALVVALIVSSGLTAAGLAAEIPAADQGAAGAKIDAALRSRLQSGRAPSLIILTNQADTSFANALPTKAAKGRAVFDALQAQAKRDQPALLAALKFRGIDGRGFLAINAIGAEIDLATAEMLAARPDVARIILDAKARRLEPVIDEPEPAFAPDAPEWGINAVNAPQVWALGYRGEGIVVAGEDTGIRWSHAALKNNYRGWNGTTVDHNYNWHDGIADPVDSNPCGPTRLTAPCDDNNHGTHTMGTAVGDDGASNQVGVAPGAKWIGCRNMDAGNGTPTTYIDCIDWMLAPYPIGGTSDQGDPAMAPDIVTNSWGCPASEGCVNTDADGIQQAIRPLIDAGIFFNTSAGNSGSGCATILNPPAVYPEAFSVGSFTQAGTISSFSSRGPVTYDGQTRLGPNITAPGSSVRSAVAGSDTAYGTMSGTSMASPHVAGVVALLWSARPELRGHVDLTRRILQETAIETTSAQTCGGVPGSSVPNNTFGYGKVDALAAIGTTLQGSITVDGSPAISTTLLIEPANVLFSTTTGAYSTTLPSGTYTVTATVPGYPSESVIVTITEGAVATQNFVFGAHDVTIENSAFEPTDLTIMMGDSVRWTNLDGIPHTTTSDTGIWDSGNLTTGQEFTQTFPTAGVFPYHCELHPNMTATITVIDPNAPTEGALTGSVTIDGSAATTATLTINPGNLTAAIDSSGTYSISLEPGTYTVTAELAGFAPIVQTAPITTGVETVRNFAFVSAASGVINGAVTLNGSAVTTATITLEPGNITASTDGLGNYSVIVAPGTYTVTASLPGLAPLSAVLSVDDGGTTTHNFDFVQQEAAFKDHIPLLLR